MSTTAHEKNARELRRRAIRRWTCPNHPDGAPVLPADGYEREELTLEEAYDEDAVAALARLCALRKRDGDLVGQTLGVCCIGHEWKTVGYEMVEVGAYESFLFSIVPQFTRTSVLLQELSRTDRDQATARIPIIRTAE